MIEVNEVTKRYGKTVAVDRLSFTVKPGIVTGFLGPNGAGKTTTMRMILGLDHPSSGAGGLPKRRVDEVLDLVGLTEVAGRKVGGFSLGMSQRLGIATALLGDPKILLFDEPVNGLDPEGIRWVRSLFRQLAGEGRTIFVSSHLMSEMEETADHVLVIGRGKLIADASIAEFTQGSTSSHVRVISPQAAELTPLLEGAGGTVSRVDGALTVTGLDAPRIGDLAAEHRIVLHELAPRRASLEAAFMELTQGSLEFHAPDADAIAETARALAGGEERS